MQPRAFNTISIDTAEYVCTKSSSNTEKLHDEVDYYRKLPRNLSDFFPKLINYRTDFSNYKIEYLPDDSLQDLFLNHKISFVEGKEIMGKLINMLDDMHSFKPGLPITSSQIAGFYIKKTQDRINALHSLVHFQAILKQPFLKINGKNYKNFANLERKFSQLVIKLAQKYNDITVIHGDFCFSNMLYSTSDRTIKLIDPRGSFTSKGIYGHNLYDFAKLMHCLHSRYDYVVNDQFDFIKYNNQLFYYAIPTSPLFDELEELYTNLLLRKRVNLEFIYLIEASLFLSMASLHYENPNRQIVFYLIGIVILNQVIEGKYENMH